MASLYCLFEGASEGMMLHKRLRELMVPHHVCPSPRHLTESCGIALKFDEAYLEQVALKAEELSLKVAVISEDGKRIR
ncbi:MAG: DUF3343 domain-containing protein [Thermanaerothrix sp.]|nr:DUF3343 domain-containing protein [Thermanaerothrix sp.]